MGPPVPVVMHGEDSNSVVDDGFVVTPRNTPSERGEDPLIFSCRCRAANGVGRWACDEN